MSRPRSRRLLPLTRALHVLLSLADGEKHGYAILKEVEQRTDGKVVLSTGTLYGIIKRLLADGMIRESARGSDERRRAYRLTAFGRKVALAEAERLRDLVGRAQTKKLLTSEIGGSPSWPTSPLHERLYRALLSALPVGVPRRLRRRDGGDFRDQRRDADGRPRARARGCGRGPSSTCCAARRASISTCCGAMPPTRSACCAASGCVGDGCAEPGPRHRTEHGGLQRGERRPLAQPALRQSERLVSIGTVTASSPAPGPIGDKLFIDLQERTHTLDRVAGWSDEQTHRRGPR